MVGLWDIVVGERMISPRGYSTLYAFELFSHRLLRYLSPLLHLTAFLTNLFLLDQGSIYVVAYCIQLLAIAAAILGGQFRWRPLLVARYYALTTLSIAAGLWDRLRRGRPGAWEKAPGTR